MNKITLAAACLLVGSTGIAQASLIDYSVTAVFNEPMADNTIFVGSFTWDDALKQITNLSGRMNSSMQSADPNDMAGLVSDPVNKNHSVGLNFQVLPSVNDGSGGVSATVFLNNSQNIFGNGLTYGTVPQGNNSPTDGTWNAFFTLNINATDPLLSNGTLANINKLVYGDCTAGGLMGSKCMTGVAGEMGGAMMAKPLSLTITAVPVPGAVWLLGSALAGMGIIGRRRNQAG
jgi:hypothetical protein